MAEASKLARGWEFTTGKEATDTKAWYVEKVILAAPEISCIVCWPGQMIYRIEASVEPEIDPGSGYRGTSATVRHEFVGLSEAGSHEVLRRTSRAEHHSQQLEHRQQPTPGYLGAKDR